MENISIMDALVTALTGYGVVFLGIILLMIVVMIMGSIFSAKEKKAAAAPAPTPVEVPKATAPGTAGELKLHDVEPKTAAMLMAIVADKLGKPLNELRFISIKEDK
ncbi:MAG: OadG family protein [Oscillospiraceae bacterium]|nr:OadG family protein [Oscillospiraceae bacterium]